MTSGLAELHSDPKLAERAAAIALEGFAGPGSPEAESKSAYRALVDAGSELWLDTGDSAAAKKVWAAELSGLTTNNTLVNQVVQTGALDEAAAKVGKQLTDAIPGISEKDLIIEAGFILNARIALGLVQDFGTKVSVELHPDVAHDWQATLAFGRRYYQICPSHFIVKVPLTPDGLIAVRKLSDEGIPVNFTLGFSARQNYFAALFSRPAYVNVFLGRLGSVVKEAKLGSGDNVGERATLASQEALKEIRGAHPEVPTKQIAASIRSGAQVAALAGVDVHTIPPKAAAEYLELASPKLGSGRASELKVEFECEPHDAAKLRGFYDIPEELKAFAEEAARRVDGLKDGQELVKLGRELGVTDLFRNWTPEETAKIKAGGKIPDLVRWLPVAAPDDLMTQAALQSFAEDQAALDARLAKQIGR